MFNFSASEKLRSNFKGRYTYFDTEEKKVCTASCAFLVAVSDIFF